MHMTVTKDGPEWLRAAVVLGVPAVIALALVWWTTQVVDSRLQLLQTAMAATAENASTAHLAMVRAEQAMAVFADESRQSDARVVQLLQQLCRHSATTPAQLEGCR